MKSDAVPYPEAGDPLVPAPTPDAVNTALFPACSRVAELTAGCINSLPVQPRKAILEALQAGTPLDVNFRLQSDGSFTVTGSMNGVALFTINTTESHERGN